MQKRLVIAGWISAVSVVIALLAYAAPAPFRSTLAHAGLAVVVLDFAVVFVQVLNWHDDLLALNSTTFAHCVRLLMFTYLSVTILFAIAYWLALLCGYEFREDAARMSVDGLWRTMFKCLYISAVTSSTLGFGDFAPKDLVPRIICIVNCSFGPVFVGTAFTLAVSLSPKLFSSQGTQEPFSDAE